MAIFQYLLPLLIVLFIYALIYKYLSEQQYPRHLRQSKTNKLLASISLTHCVIWLPFSIFNILADLVSTYFYISCSKKLDRFYNWYYFSAIVNTLLLFGSTWKLELIVQSPNIFGTDPETIITVYCVVHLVGLTSTCTNPVLYAFFNENLRREFDGILECFIPGFRYPSSIF